MEKNRAKIFYLVRLALLAALVVLLSLIPAGVLRIGPLELVLVHIPVIIGALILGPVAGLTLGTVFGLMMLAISPSNPLAGLIWAVSPMNVIVGIVLPRMLMGYLTGWFGKGMQALFKGKKAFVGDALTGIVGSGLNTALFLSALWLLSADIIRPVFESMEEYGSLAAFFISVITINGGTEAALAAILTPAICQALRVYQQRQGPGTQTF